MRRHPSLRLRAVPVPSQKASDETSTASPLPRHWVGRVHPSLATRANHPVYQHHELHIVNDDNDTADYYDGALPDLDNRSRTSGANVSPAAGAARGDAMPCPDRQSDRGALVAVRTLGRAVGDRDRMARIQLSSRRDVTDRLRGRVPACDPHTLRSVLDAGVLRPADSRVRAGSEHRGGRSPVLVVGAFALALVIWTLILGVIV